MQPEFFRELADTLNERLDIVGEPEEVRREIVVAFTVICDAIADVLSEGDDDAND